MNKCDPFYCEGLTGVTFFDVALFGVVDCQEAWWCGCGGLAGGGRGGWDEEVEGVVGFWSG